MDAGGAGTIVKICGNLQIDGSEDQLGRLCEVAVNEDVSAVLRLFQPPESSAER